jgi:GPH family glycoside/pentoside/hexuronide:cation symporter
MTLPTTPQRLPRLTKFLYGAGDFGFALFDTTLAVLFAIFLTDVVGLRPGLAALALFVGRSWDYVNDPLIGLIVDRTRTRWGRRRPYLLFGFVPLMLVFILLWWKPPIAAEWDLAVYYGAAYLLFDTTLTFVALPYFALTPELTQDYDERTSLTSYRMSFSILGGLIAFVVPMALIGTMRPENASRVLGMAALFGVIGGLPLLLTFFGTRERTEFQSQRLPGFRESLRAARRNRPFLFAAGIFLFTWTAVEIIQAMLLFFLKYRMNLEAESDLIAGVIFITALVVLPLWVWASNRFDKRKAYIGGMIFFAAVMIALIAIDPSWGMPVILGLACLAGIGVSAVHVLTWAIIPDAVEWDEAQTGQRHEGMFYSLVTLFKKVSSSVAVPLTLVVLEWSGFVSNAPSQPASAVRAIQWFMGPIPSALLLAGIAFAVVYPLNRQIHAETRQKISQRRSEAPDGIMPSASE